MSILLLRRPIWGTQALKLSIIDLTTKVRESKAELSKGRFQEAEIRNISLSVFSCCVLLYVISCTYTYIIFFSNLCSLLGQQIDNNNRQNFAADRHFSFLPDSCLYMVHFGLGSFFRLITKLVGT